MKRILFFYIILIFLVVKISGQSHQLAKAQEFIPNVFKDLDVYALTMEPNGKVLYVTVDDDGFHKSTLRNGEWSQLEKIQFSSGKLEDNDLFPSPDNSGIYFFMSTRNSPGKPQSLWAVERKKKKWGQPYPLSDINSKQRDGFPSVDKDGNLYFFSEREGGYGRSDLYISRLVNGKFEAPKNLGSNFNTNLWDGLPYITPNGKALIYFTMKEEDSYGGGDLFISYKKNNQWSKPENLGPNVNTELAEVTPFIDPSLEYLYFARVQRIEGKRKRTIYRVKLDDTNVDRSYLE